MIGELVERFIGESHRGEVGMRDRDNGNCARVKNRKCHGINMIQGGTFNPRYKSQVMTYERVTGEFHSENAKGGEGGGNGKSGRLYRRGAEFA